MVKQKNKYSAFETGLYYLSFKSRTRQELENKLREKEYSEEDINEAMNKLISYNYIDDNNYAFSYIKANISKKSKKVIAIELRKKGVDNEAIMTQLDYFEDNDEEHISVILHRRFSNVDFADRKQKDRVVAYFARRGYSFTVINNAISKITL